MCLVQPYLQFQFVAMSGLINIYMWTTYYFRVTTSPLNSVVRALDLKTPGCGLNSRAGQSKNY